MLAEMIVGRTIAARGELTAENLIEALDNVPLDKLHYPPLTIAALRDALSKWSGDGGGPLRIGGRSSAE